MWRGGREYDFIHLQVLHGVAGKNFSNFFCRFIDNFFKRCVIDFCCTARTIRVRIVI